MGLFRRPVTDGSGGRIAIVLLCILLAAPALQTADAPRTIGLTERAGTRLAQLDVTVIGSPEAIASLTRDDFRVKINRTRIPEFRLDRLCVLPTDDPAPIAAPRATYLLYFDQTHLTSAGRIRALELGRDLIDRLIEKGHRAIIVSNARDLEMIAPLTANAEALHEAIDRLEKDPLQWDTYSEREESRIAAVIHDLNDQADVQKAIATARRFQKEEQWRADRSFRRLELTLGQLVDLDAPKALIYFADTLRSNAGEHYLSFFGQGLKDQDGSLKTMQASATMAGLAHDRVINEAAAQAIRIYTVEARGLVTLFDSSPTSAALSRTRSVPSSSRDRINDTHRTLRDMAGETGGHAFLNGVSSGRISRRIIADSSCLFLISFDPTGLRQDMPLRAKVEIDRDDIEVRVRGRLVVQSDSARATSRLLRAFGSPGTITDPFEVKTSVIPTGFDGGAYTALLQLRVPGMPLHGTTWDLGVSVVFRDKVQQESSGRLSMSGPGVPIVYECELEFKPGSYEIVAVAHEASSGLIASQEITLDWPDDSELPATVGPIALLQPSSGAFLRAGETRSSGSLARDRSDPIFLDRPTALIGLVCRNRRRGGAVRVERRLVGNSAVDLPPLSFDLSEDRCAQLRDLLRENTLVPGAYRYEVRVLQHDRVVDERSREFVIVGPST